MKYFFVSSVLLLIAFDKEGSAASFNDQCVQAHNAYRMQEGKPTLTTDFRLVNHAQRRANQLSASCSFDHNGNLGSGYGENLAFGYYNCAQSVKMWYDEKRFYRAPVFSAQTGHYTQVVWRGTTKVGCATAPHCRYRTITVCSYYPPGNMQGQFQNNV